MECAEYFASWWGGCCKPPPQALKPLCSASCAPAKCASAMPTKTPSPTRHRTASSPANRPKLPGKASPGWGVKKVDGVLTEGGALIPGLRAGRFDVIAAGMYVTPGRCKQVAFADPQYQIADTLLVLK